jgi:hypothetical protein
MSTGVDANAHAESAQSRTPDSLDDRYSYHMAGVAVMTPDSTDGRERITRLEERVESNRRQIEMLGPLPLQVGLVQRGQDELREDMAELRHDIDDRFKSFVTTQVEWQQQFSRSVDGQLGHCSNEIAKVAKSFEEELARREKDREIKEQSATQRFVARYGLVTGLVVVLISSLTSIGLAIFGGP